MKKFLAVFVSVVLMLSVVSIFSGCGNSGEEIASGGEESEVKTDKKASDKVEKIYFGNYASAAILENGKAYVWGNCYPGNGEINKEQKMGGIETPGKVVFE